MSFPLEEMFEGALIAAFDDFEELELELLLPPQPDATSATVTTRRARPVSLRCMRGSFLSAGGSIVNRSTRRGYEEPTRSGKYGGASRTPILGSPPAVRRAISSAAPTPCTGTKPSWRAATSS